MTRFVVAESPRPLPTAHHFWRVFVGVSRGIAVAALIMGAAGAALAHSKVPSERHADRALMVPNSGSTVNWPQFGFDAGHGSYNRYERTLSVDNVDQVQQAWSFSTGTGNTAGNVVLENGVIYAASSNGTLFALNAATGTQLWSYATGRGFQTSGSVVAVDSGLVFTVCNMGASQGICALDAASGALKWQYAVPGATSLPETAPAVFGGIVYFGACGGACSYVALNELTGKVRWTTDEPEDSCALNNGWPPAIGNGRVFGGVQSCTTDFFVALNDKDGVLQWEGGETTYTFGGVTTANGLVCAVGLYAETNTMFATMYTWEGLTNWSLGFGGAFTFPNSPPAIGESHCFVPSNGLLFFFDLKVNKHGRPRARWIEGYELTPAVANGVVYDLIDDVPSAVSVKTGQTLWQASPGTAAAAPIVINGTVFGACNQGDICAWTLPATLVRNHRPAPAGRG